MYTRLATMTAAAILTTTTAFAATLSTRSTVENTEQCKHLIAVTEQTVVEQDDIGEKASNQVSDLMNTLHQQCSNGQFEQADETAALIRGLVATE